MDQIVAVNKTIRDMKLAGILDETTGPESRLYLNILYTVAWEAAKHDRNNNCERPVIQFESSGKRIASYPSVTAAANHLKCTRDGLYKAIRKGTPTKKGFIWVYAEPPKPKKNKKLRSE